MNRDHVHRGEPEIEGPLERKKERKKKTPEIYWKSGEGIEFTQVVK